MTNVYACSVALISVVQYSYHCNPLAYIFLDIPSFMVVGNQVTLMFFKLGLFPRGQFMKI